MTPLDFLANNWLMIAGVAGTVYAFFSGMAKGRKAVRDEVQAADTAALKKAREAENEVDNLTEDELRDRAISRGWVRDDRRR